jgi:hypothetical protein
MNMRYKLKEKEKNRSGKTVEMIPFSQHKWKYQFTYQPNSGPVLKTQLDYNLYVDDDDKTSGWSVSQSLGYKKNSSKFHIDLSLAYFNVTNWNNRIYSYEKNILYAFNAPSFYGEGIRYYATIKWNIHPVFNIYAKISTSHYFDKNTIGSGLEKINGREKSELNLLLKFNL